MRYRSKDIQRLIRRNILTPVEMRAVITSNGLRVPESHWDGDNALIRVYRRALRRAENARAMTLVRHGGGPLPPEYPKRPKTQSDGYFSSRWWTN